MVVGPPHKPGGRDLSQAGQIGAHHTPGSPRLEARPGSGLPPVRSSLRPTSLNRFQRHSLAPGDSSSLGLPGLIAAPLKGPEAPGCKVCSQFTLLQLPALKIIPGSRGNRNKRAWSRNWGRACFPHPPLTNPLSPGLWTCWGEEGAPNHRMEGPSLRRAEDRGQNQLPAAEDPVVKPMQRAQNGAWHTLRLWVLAATVTIIIHLCYCLFNRKSKSGCMCHSHVSCQQPGEDE